MAFKMLVPPPKKGASISVTTAAGRGGSWTVQLNIPTTIFTIRFGEAAKFDLMLGEGEDEGKLLIKPNPTGHFSPKMMKHTAIFKLPLGDDRTPTETMKVDGIETREQSDGSMLVELPTWCQKGQYAKIVEARRAPPAPPRVVPMGLK